MVLVLAIPLRSVYGLQGLITDKHLDNCGKVMLATGLIVAYAYILEAFTGWYSGNPFEAAATWNVLADDKPAPINRRQFLWGVAIHIGRRRRNEVRPDGATAQPRDEDGRDRRRGASTETTSGP